MIMQITYDNPASILYGINSNYDHLTLFMMLSLIHGQLKYHISMYILASLIKE